MARAESLGNLRIILAALVLIANQQANRCTGGFAFKHTGKNLDCIRLFTLRDVARGAGLATVQLQLDFLCRDFHARRATIHHTTNCRAVALAEGGNAKQQTEGITGHPEIAPFNSAAW